MRILLANSYFFPAVGGIENYLLNVGRELVRLGHGVTVLAGRHDANLPLSDELNGIRIERYEMGMREAPRGLWNGPRRIGRCRRAARALLDAESFDVIWARDIYSLVALQRVGSRPPILYIQAVSWTRHLQATFVPPRGRRWRSVAYQYVNQWWNTAYLSSLEKRAVLAAERRVVLSRAMRDELAGHFGIPHGMYRVIPAGVCTDRFRPGTDEERREIRRRLGIPGDAFVFLYVGRFGAEKNPAGAVRAFAKLGADPSAILAMVGPVPDGFPQWAEGQVLRGRIVFPGAIPEPSQWYRMADVHVLPSLTEGFGQVTLEAMASGLPVLGFAPGKNGPALATSEIVVDGETGVLVPYGEEDSLSAAMERLVADPQAAQRMGRLGRDRVCGSFSWAKVAGELLALGGEWTERAESES